MSPTLKNIIFFCLLLVNLSVHATLYGSMCKMKTGAIGICSTIMECKTIDESLKQKKITFTDLVHCTYRGKEHIICCPDADRFPVDFTSTTEHTLIFKKNATKVEPEGEPSTVTNSESDDMWKTYIESIRNTNELNSTEKYPSTSSPSSDDLWNSYLDSLRSKEAIATTETATTTTVQTIVVGEVKLDKDSEFFDLSQMLGGGGVKNEKMIAMTADNNAPVSDMNPWQNSQQPPSQLNHPMNGNVVDQFRNTPPVFIGNQMYNEGNSGNQIKQISTQPQLNNHFQNRPIFNELQNTPQPQNGFFPPTINYQQELQPGLNQPTGRWHHSPPVPARWQQGNGPHNLPRFTQPISWPMNGQIGPQTHSHHHSMRGQFRHGGGGHIFHKNQNQIQAPPNEINAYGSPKKQLFPEIDSLCKQSHSSPQASSERTFEDPLGPFKFRSEIQPTSSFDLLHNAEQSSNRNGSSNNSNSKEKLLRSEINAESDRPAVVACQRLRASLRNELTQKILEGIPAELGEFPHMAAIGFPQIGNDLNYTFDCGGSLISDKFVLTAAHCLLESRRQPVIIRLGKVAIHSDRDIDNVGTVDVGIKRIIPHDLYSTSETYNDIGLIELERSVEFNRYVRPTCVHTELADLDLNTKLYVTGWGTVDRATRRVSGILLKADLQISPLEQCNDTQVLYGLNRRLSRGVIPDQLCAFDPKARKDACQGDSGGPLQLVIDENLYSYSVVGIVSSGFGCGTTTPGLYTRVAGYLDFIEKHVWPTGG